VSKLWEWLTSLFRRSTVRPYILHPEEPAVDSHTVANTPSYLIFNHWFTEWQVPSEHWDYWLSAIVVWVYDVWPSDMFKDDPSTPAGTWTDGQGKRNLAVLAKWFNAGVVAHEQAHNSYALMTPETRMEFAAIYNSIKETDPYIKLLYSINTYGLSSDVEGHAEVYRYLGSMMPTTLKRFYPKLF
jgi:hypothetical protein